MVLLLVPRFLFCHSSFQAGTFGWLLTALRRVVVEGRGFKPEDS
jgi:hypothetical protein